MVNDSTDIIEKVEGKKPVRKLFVALAIVGAALGFAVASFFAFIKPLPEVSNADYSSTIEVKSSHPATSSAVEVAVVETGTDQVEPSVEAEPVVQEREECVMPEFDDPNKFALELTYCEFTVFEINESGKPVAINPSETARQVIEDNSSVVSIAPGPSRKPSTGSSSSQSSGSSSGGSSTPAPAPEQSAPIPAPAPAPVSNWCPQSRGENPAVYDACRAGFSMPSGAEYTGVVSCSPANGERTAWNVTIGVRLVGGSYGATSWHGFSGGGNSGTTSFTIHGIPEDQLGYESVLSNFDFSVSFQSMDGRYQGEIAFETFHGTAYGSLGACR